MVDFKAWETKKNLYFKAIENNWTNIKPQKVTGGQIYINSKSPVPTSYDLKLNELTRK